MKSAKLENFKLFGNLRIRGESIRLLIDNKTSNYQKIKIALGLILYSKEPWTQNMVIARDGTACLPPGDPEVLLYASCVNSEKGTPSRNSEFFMGPQAPKELLQVLKENDLEGSYENIEKVWKVTNKLHIGSIDNKIKTGPDKTIKKSNLLKEIIIKIKMITVGFIVMSLGLYLLYEKFILKREKTVLSRIFMLLKFLIKGIVRLFKRNKI